MAGLYKKLHAAMGEIDAIEKRGTNDFSKYKYQKATDVASVVRKALQNAGIVPLLSMKNRQDVDFVNKEGKVMHFVRVTAELVFVDADDENLRTQVLTSFGEASDSGDKAVYKAITGATKYALRQAFLIPDENDPEGDTKVDKAAAGDDSKVKAPNRKPKPGMITREQRAQLFALAKTRGISETAFKTALEKAKYTSTEMIPAEDFTAVEILIRKLPVVGDDGEIF